MAVEILSVFKEQTSKWGVTVERVEVGYHNLCRSLCNSHQVMSLCVAREMVVPMAMEAKAAREVLNQQFLTFTFGCLIRAKRGDQSAFPYIPIN